MLKRLHIKLNEQPLFDEAYIPSLRGRPPRKRCRWLLADKDVYDITFRKNLTLLFVKFQALGMNNFSLHFIQPCGASLLALGELDPVGQAQRA